MFYQHCSYCWSGALAPGRAAVAVVLITHPWVSSCLWVKHKWDLSYSISLVEPLKRPWIHRIPNLWCLFLFSLLVTWQHVGCHGDIWKKSPPSYMMGADMTTAAFKQQTNTLVTVGAKRISWIPSYLILSEIIVCLEKNLKCWDWMFKMSTLLKNFGMYIGSLDLRIFKKL